MGSDGGRRGKLETGDTVSFDEWEENERRGTVVSIKVEEEGDRLKWKRG